MTLLWCEDVGLSFLSPHTWDFCGKRTVALTSATNTANSNTKTSGGSSGSSGSSTSSSATTSASSSDSSSGDSPSPVPGANHVLIIAVGTHFKAANHPQQDYEARRARSVATMGSQVHAFRAYLRESNYPGTVIWSLKPHHGKKQTCIVYVLNTILYCCTL